MVVKDSSDVILKYFPALTDVKKNQFLKLGEFYAKWNARVNLISRKDLSFLYLKHVLHSLALVKAIRETSVSEIIDLGTGGGFPGIPLAIMFPDRHFHLVDSIGKKINVIDEASEALNLTNISTYHNRIEELSLPAEMLVSRAVARTKVLLNWIRPLTGFKKIEHLLLLKGGDLELELAEVRGWKVRKEPISDYFTEPFFESKYIVHLELSWSKST